MWWRRLRYILLLLLLCSIATCPAAKRACTAKARAVEAEELMAYLTDRVTAALTTTGKVPATAAGPSPAVSCCDQGGACAEDPQLWEAPGWKALAFSVDDEHRYMYAYEPDPSGRAAVIRAVGDLDCDGIAATYEVKISIGANGIEKQATRTNPYE
jgi:hypothetical protein